MTFTEIKKNKDNYEVNVFYSKKSNQRSKSYYRTIIDKNPQKLAQFFIDLYLDGFPVLESFGMMEERMKSQDWLGL